MDTMVQQTQCWSDCSMLLGAMLALRRRGCYRLLYIDDVGPRQPHVNPLSGAATGSELAFVTGRGPDTVADIEDRDGSQPKGAHNDSIWTVPSRIARSPRPLQSGGSASVASPRIRTFSDLSASEPDGSEWMPSSLVAARRRRQGRSQASPRHQRRDRAVNRPGESGDPAAEAAPKCAHCQRGSSCRT
jgi:hypothetical protein